MFARTTRHWLHQTLMAFRSRDRRRPMSRRRLLPSLDVLEGRAVPATVTLSPSADNTLYEHPEGQLSSGSGQQMFVGTTNQFSNAARRAAIKFNLSSIPAGSTVTSAMLSLNMSKTNNGSQMIELHRALKDWGEGASDASTGGQGGGGGDGVQAQSGDATWLHTQFSSQTWTNAGGDFSATASAATSVNSFGKYQWSGAAMTADVQQWVNSPATSFGWILTGNESTKPTIKTFDTKENSSPSNRPQLTVVFDAPAAADLAITKTHTGNFRQGDTNVVYTLTVNNVGAGPTSGTVTVTDTLPPGLTPTAANSGAINGWTVTTVGQTVTATRNNALANGASFPPLPVTVNVANNAPANVINTATVAGGGDVNATNNTATDPTTIAPAAAAPQVVSVTVNGNTASLSGPQRSRVASLVVVFDQAVQLDLNALKLALHTNNVSFNGAGQASGLGDLPTTLNSTTTDNTTFIVTFAGNTDLGLDTVSSLRDGVYDFIVTGSLVHPFGVPAVSMAGNSTTTFHRLFGDTGLPATPAGGTAGADFQAIVNSGDNLTFRGAFNNAANYKAFLDFNGDGIINSGDNLQFRTRFNKPLSWRV